MKVPEEVWIVDDDQSIRWVLEKALHNAGIKSTCFDNADAVIQRLQQEAPAVILSDIRMPGTDGLSLLDHVKSTCPELPVIIMTAYADLDRAVAAFEGGAFEYLPKPFDVDEAVTIVSRALSRGSTGEVTAIAGEASRMPGIIGIAPAMQEVFRAIGRLSRSNITVLLNGESGTGKELVAQALHRHSPRRDKPFIALNTAAIPRDLLESELFGHERGAFTGATGQRKGHFEQADEGTLFLDEIGDMPTDLQTRLLRVLSDGEFYSVGGHVPIKVDVRVIAATHQDLEARVREGRFRADLFHRLNVIRLQLPPLRERCEDIPALADYFLASAAEELGVACKHLLDDTLSRMQDYSWPGNVRQLENVCHWITVMAPARDVHPEDLPQELLERRQETAGTGDWRSLLRRWAEACLNSGETELLSRALPDFERVMIEVAMNRSGGRRQDAAQLLGWGRNTLTRKIKDLGMDV